MADPAEILREFDILFNMKNKYEKRLRRDQSEYGSIY